MLVQHLGIVPIDTDRLLHPRSVWHAVTAATTEAHRRLSMTLAGGFEYNETGDIPFTAVYVSEFVAGERSVDSWSVWGEGVQEDGQVHVGLVLEGRPGRKVRENGQHRVRRWDRLVTDSFARHLADVAPLLVQGYVLDDWYVVSGHTDHGDQSQVVPIPAARPRRPTSHSPNLTERLAAQRARA